ncbi:meiotic recombination protein SPO11 isoform X1 [Serinus canaria]|uniref:meiotic recombination protein SPO11 isoform X1 n=1 Tax=Serinus canaria TaxID=9135 RepID=UPI0021CC8334|nr:meiotic recombination protein SPO11 isoform X1 [Serinus canaria]
MEEHSLCSTETPAANKASFTETSLAGQESHVPSSEVLEAIENVIQGVLQSLAQKKAPVLTVANRADWRNIEFKDSVGLQMIPGCTTKQIRSDCPQSARRFALTLKILSMIYKMVQSNTYATKRDIYYSDTLLFGSQSVVDQIINDISCMLKIPRRSLHVLSTTKGFVAGNLSYTEEDGTKVNCTCSATAVTVPSNVQGIKSVEIMCVYKYGSVSMSFEAHHLTVPSVKWLGLLPSDLERLNIRRDALIPFTKQDENKLASIQKRPYIACQPLWKKELEIMAASKLKAEIQVLTSVSADYLSRVYLPNKLQFGGWL